MIIKRPRVYDLVKLAEFLQISEENIDDVLTSWIICIKDPKITFNIASENKQIIGVLLYWPTSNTIQMLVGSFEIKQKLLKNSNESVNIIVTNKAETNGVRTSEELSELEQLGFKVKQYILEHEVKK